MNSSMFAQFFRVSAYEMFDNVGVNYGQRQHDRMHPRRKITDEGGDCIEGNLLS